ncbi:helix-turn-helix domain-containing protein [Pseudomonas aeruginosa]|nr:helix-turn-helix domain-containing protein [Pseudomonas aeruginosa]
MGIGGRIREAVESLGLTLKQAAERCEIPYSSMQNWAGGHREPRPDALITIGSRLGISIDWLLSGEGPMRRGEAGQVGQGAAESPREQALLALWRELDEDAQREIQRAAEEKKRLNTLEQRVSELEAVVAAGKRLA